MVHVCTGGTCFPLGQLGTSMHPMGIPRCNMSSLTSFRIDLGRKKAFTRIGAPCRICRYYDVQERKCLSLVKHLEYHK